MVHHSPLERQIQEALLLRAEMKCMVIPQTTALSLSGSSAFKQKAAEHPVSTERSTTARGAVNNWEPGPGRLRRSLHAGQGSAS